MIIDVQRFVEKERPFWQELEGMLDRLGQDAHCTLDLDALKRFHYLAERTSADLVQIRDLVTESELQRYLESLVSRAFCEIQDKQARGIRFRPLHWFFKTFPQTFRRYVRCFALSLSITMVGVLFGGGAVVLDPQAKEAIMPWGHLMQSPSERVQKEEMEQQGIDLKSKQVFSAYLMTHNTKVSIFVMALGIGWGIGSIALLFYNGVILGAVVADYLMAGEGVFLTGWLLPHGSIEIPAILIAGQAGLLLASAVIGWNNRQSLRMRLRTILPDTVTLIGGVTCLLVWAGLVEAYLSQDHEPVIPYGLKISVGVVELVLLFSFLFLSGRERTEEESD